MLLEVKNLKTYFYTDDGVSKAVDDVSLYLEKGETLGLVGESGCGKSVTALSIMNLIPNPPGKIVVGEILYNGIDILKLSSNEIRKIRGNKISMVFQEPMTSLNPVYTCGNQIDEVIILHQKLNKNEAKEKSINLLKLVGIPAPEQRYKEYPHQMSGGMRQRVMIAIALACKPDILIADEPTTALDVTVQASILKLIKDLQKELGLGLIIITHDLGVIAEVCDRVDVMYASKIVESGKVNDIYLNPKHPYTIGLMKSIPKINLKQEKLYTIDGTVPSAMNYPPGCRFSPRCYLSDKQCENNQPEIAEINQYHSTSCWNYDKIIN